MRDLTWFWLLIRWPHEAIREIVAIVSECIAKCMIPTWVENDGADAATYWWRANGHQIERRLWSRMSRSKKEDEDTALQAQLTISQLSCLDWEFMSSVDYTKHEINNRYSSILLNAFHTRTLKSMTLTSYPTLPLWSHQLFRLEVPLPYWHADPPGHYRQVWGLLAQCGLQIA